MASSRTHTTRRTTPRNAIQGVTTTIFGEPYAATIPERRSAITEVEEFETRPQTIVHNVWPDEAVSGISTRRGRANGWQIAGAVTVFVVGGYLFAKVTGS